MRRGVCGGGGVATPTFKSYPAEMYNMFEPLCLCAIMEPGYECRASPGADTYL